MSVAERDQGGQIRQKRKEGELKADCLPAVPAYLPENVLWRRTRETL